MQLTTLFFKRDNKKPQVASQAFYYLRPETGKFERVTPEVWGWVAIYQDGTWLAQFDTTKPLPQFGDNAYEFHQIREIDNSRLHMFKMVNLLDQTKEHVVLIDPERMKFLHKYSRFKLYENTPYVDYPTVYCFGYELKMSGFTQKFWNCIMPDGNIIATDNPDNIKIVNPEAEEYVQKLIDEAERKGKEEKERREKELREKQIEIEKRRRDGRTEAKPLDIDEKSNHN